MRPACAAARAQFSWDVAVYRAELDNELLNFIVNPALGIPAATFNAGPTVHQGIEAGPGLAVRAGVAAAPDLHLSDFRFDERPGLWRQRPAAGPAAPLPGRAALRPSGRLVHRAIGRMDAVRHLGRLRQHAEGSGLYRSLNLGAGWTFNDQRQPVRRRAQPDGRAICLQLRRRDRRTGRLHGGLLAGRGRVGLRRFEVRAMTSGIDNLRTASPAPGLAVRGLSHRLALAFLCRPAGPAVPDADGPDRGALSVQGRDRRPGLSAAVAGRGAVR